MMSIGKSDLEKLNEFYSKGLSLVYDSNNNKYNSGIEPIPDADTSIVVQEINSDEGFEIEYNGTHYFVNLDTLKVYDNYIFISSTGIYNFVVVCDDRPHTWAELIETTYGSPYEFIIDTTSFENEEVITFPPVAAILWKESQTYEPDTDIWNGCRVNPEDEIHWGTNYSWWTS